jgi:hypothetical protein
MEIPIDEPMQVVMAGSVLELARLVLQQTSSKMLIVVTTKAGEEIVLEPVIKKIHLRFPELIFECQLSQISGADACLDLGSGRDEIRSCPTSRSTHRQLRGAVTSAPDGQIDLVSKCSHRLYCPPEIVNFPTQKNQT